MAMLQALRSQALDHSEFDATLFNDLRWGIASVQLRVAMKAFRQREIVQQWESLDTF